MKRCPSCNADYFDEMLEFCLEDGAKLISITNPVVESPTAAAPNRINLDAGGAVNLPFSNIPQTLESNAPNNLPESFSAETIAVAAPPLKEKVTSQGYKVLEVAPIVVSLAHNWWQWVYLRGQYYSSFSNYFFSANFLMWLLLLAASAVAGLLALKLCRNKSFAYTGLIILAINLLLFLAPGR